MNPAARVLLCATTLVVVGVVSASRSWADTPKPVATAKSAASPTPADTATPISLGIGTPLPNWTSPESRLLEREWWNQPDIVKALDLKDSQRSQMDEQLKQAFEVQRVAQQKQRENRIAFDDAVGKGDWDAAKKAAEGLHAATADQLGGQDQVKLAVLPLLTDEQRQKLISQYGFIVRRPWIVGVPMVGNMRFRGGSAPHP